MTPLPTSLPTAIYGDQNSTNVTQCLEKKEEDWTYTVLSVYTMSIAVLGIIFNLFVLMVFCLHKKPCAVAEIYLSNLAAADLFLVSCLPFWAVSAYQKYNWPFSGFLCKVVNLSIVMNIYCSIYFLVMVSIDRYLALVHPLSHESIRRPKFAKLSCLLVWVFGLLMSIPKVIYREVKYLPKQNNTICYYNYPNITVLWLVDVILLMFGLIIPISIISFCTFKITGALNNRLKDRSSTQMKEQKATVLVFTVLVAFLICWVPFHLTRTIELFIRAKVLKGCRLGSYIETSRQVFLNIGYFNSVLNPILYVIVGKNFQHRAMEFFKQRRHTSGTSHTTHTSMTRSVKTAVS